MGGRTGFVRKEFGLAAATFVTLAMCLSADAADESSKTTAWWRFNGTAGTTPTEIAPFAGTTKSLKVTKTHSTYSHAVSFDERTAGSRIVTNRTTGAELDISEFAAGSLNVPANGENSAYFTCDNSDGTVIGLDAACGNDTESFTAEIVFRMDSWKYNWAEIISFTGVGAHPLYVQPQFPSATWQIRCDRQKDNESVKQFSITAADGRWHHLAVTYDSATTNVCVWFDYVCKANYKLKYHMGAATSLSFLGMRFDGALEDVRISRGVLPDTEFLAHATSQPADFFYPLNDATPGSTLVPYDVRRPVVTEQSSVFKATAVNGTQAGAFRYLYDASGLPYAVSYAALFDATSAFATTFFDPILLEKNAFTLEAFVYPTATGAYDVFSHDGVWSLGADANGRLAWTCGTSAVSWETAVLTSNVWHHVALVSDPSAATVTAYLDGTAAGTVADVVFPNVTGAFALGRGFKGKAYGFRGTPSALTPAAFLKQSPSAAEPSATLARWTFDAPGHEGEAVSSSAATTFASADGLPNWSVHGYYFSSGNTTYSPTSVDTDKRWALPRITNDVPNRCTWDAASGRIINPENATSVRLTNGDTNGTVGVAGSLLRIDTSASLLPAEYTVEFFTKLTRKIAFANIVNVGNDNDVQWMLDTNDTTGKPRIRVDLNGARNQNTAWGSNLTDGWHHLALQVRTNAYGNANVVCYFDYKAVHAGNWDNNAWIRSSGYVINVGARCGRAWDGFVDELRITSGRLSSDHFMRAFTPRADLQSLWLTRALDPAEVYSGTNYLAGAFSGGVVASGALPFDATRFTSKNRIVIVNRSLAFDGTGCFTVPCAAFAGITNFTIEATVRGTGGVFAKRRFQGDSWRVATEAQGRLAVALDTFTPGAYRDFDPMTVTSVSEIDFNDGAWHHVAFTADRVGGVGRLYADGAAVAEISLASLKLDAGDLVVGDGFKGEIFGLRLSPSVLAPDDFMRAHRPRGFVMFFR